MTMLNKTERMGGDFSKTYLLGTNIQQSLSPSIHNSLFRKLRIRATYSLYDVQDSEFEFAISRILQDRNVLGFNVTSPFKERVIQHLSKIDLVCSSTGAVNTVKMSTRGLSLGYNSDVDGVKASLTELGFSGKKRGRNQKATVLGAGGAARACVYAILKTGITTITIANRSSARAEVLIHHFSTQFPRSNLQLVELESDVISQEIVDSNLLINALSDDASNVRVDFTRAGKGLRFLDLGYKHESRLLSAARESGKESLDGLVMLSEQARKSFEIWTGVKPPSELVRSIARRSLKRMQESE